MTTKQVAELNGMAKMLGLQWSTAYRCWFNPNVGGRLCYILKHSEYEHTKNWIISVASRSDPVSSVG